MTITKLRPTFTFDQDRLDALRVLAPEAFADGKVNWEALREALGDRVEDEGRDAEHFGLFWPGKRAARRLASMPSAGTLRPAPGEGVNEATTRHIFIEGDNLEVLKLLQKSYAGRVKMIYIDPPYNTGNDFIYSDNFTQPVEEYLRATGQADETGRVLVTNTQAGGRYHSNWLNMMYPRLRLARNLLRDDGVIFVSIDDNEAHNLRQVLSEVFGDEAFVGQIVVQLNPRGRHLDRFIAKTHEYVTVFARDTTQQAIYQLEKDERMSSEYNKQDARGAYRELELRNRNPAFNSRTRPNLYYPIYVYPETKAVSLERSQTYRVEVYPKNSQGDDSCWTWGKDKFVRENALLFASQTSEGGWRVFRKDYLIRDDGSTATTLPKALWIDREINNDYGKKAVQELFEGQTLFDFPKPPQLIKRLLLLGTDQDDTVLDFFAGSSTTAQAVLELNREDSGHRQFIMIQLPEHSPADSAASNAGYGNISELGKERIRRVIQRMQAEDAGKWTTGRDTPEDLGFRVFKLDRSHYKAWRDFEGGEVADLQTLFDRFESPLLEGWKPEDVLVEVILMEGFPLDSTTEALPEVATNTITRVSSDLVAHRLFVCLDTTVRDETIAALALGEDDIFICLDSALSDEAKVRLEDGRRVKVI